MKSKYQIWAHLMRVPYSYSARKKISKFPKAHEELVLIPQMQGKCGDKTFEHFMRWYDCETDTCADINPLARAIKLEYELKRGQFELWVRQRIKEKCEKDCFKIDMPF